MFKFYIMRHAVTDWNQARRLQGHSDIPLNKDGIAQAQKAQEHIIPLNPPLIFTSDLKRAVETAIYASQNSAPIFSSKALREAHLGEAEGLTALEIQEKFGQDLWDQWISLDPKHMNTSFPGGETKLEVIERIKNFLLKTISEEQKNNLLFISHGLASRLFVHSLKSELKTPYYVPNCALIEFQFNPSLKKFEHIGPEDFNSLTKS